MQAKNPEVRQTARPKKRWFVRWWAWILWVLLTLILICLAAGIWAWTERYALMEKQAIDLLADSGFEAELDIVSVTQTRARIKDILLRRDGEEFLRAEDLRVDYVWPDIRDGKTKRLQLAGVTGRLNLGEDWRPTESWIRDILPDGSKPTTSSASWFPENGIGLTDGTLILSSPLGEATLYVDADIPAKDTFTSDITLAPSDLSYGGYAAKGAGVISVEKIGTEIRVIGQTQTDALSNSKLDITDAHLQLDGTFDLEDMSYLGSLSLEGEDVSSALFAAGPTRLGWDGKISPRDGMTASGNWVVATENARSPRPVRAAEVAETLSLFRSLSVVPVTEHYAPEIRETVLDFILGSDVTGQGTLSHHPDGFTVNPVGALNIKSSRNQLSLSARPDQAFYDFDQSGSLISARMDAVFKNPVGLTLTDIRLQAASENGISLDGIKNFSTNLATQSNWQAVDAEGLPVRLGPLTSSLRYTAKGSPRQLSITTALDYDGVLPGGVVEGLNLDGVLDVRLYEGRQVLDFTPRSDSAVTLKTLTTPTDWQGEDIVFTLPATQALFTRTAEKSVLAATLTAADFTLTRPETNGSAAQRLDIDSAAMDLNGTLFPDATQDWTVDFTSVNYASETLPSPGTTASGAKASLTARLAPGEPLQIALSSPSITAETPLVRMSNIEINLRGMPDAYVVDHKGGTITGIGTEFADAAKSAGLSSFPANGSVTFEDEAFSGQAVLSVAKANNASVNVDYTYQDGVGTAAFDIPSIIFAPKGLQPQTLIPAFRGKVARVDGEARAKLNIAFADGALTASSGSVQLVDMDVGTAPGPISGLNTTLQFASLWPLETDGQQMLTMKSFNPGFPLEDGVMSFTLIPDGVKVDAADWPIGNGSFSLDPFTWIYTAEENRVTMRVKDVALSDFLSNFGNSKIQATGNVVGVFPVVVRGIDVLIEQGRISVPDGGLIKYSPGPSVPVFTQSEALDIFRQRNNSEYAALAQDALREFEYRLLSVSMDGPINGDMEIGLVFDGSNKKVLNGQPFRFNITVNGELLNIARSFNSNAQFKSEILRQAGQLPEGTLIGE